MKVSLCTEMIFSNEPLHEKLPEVKRAGYEAFEFWGWENKDIDALASAVKETGLKVAAFCTKNNCLVDASKRDEYVAGLKETIPVAKRLGCTTLITTVGQQMEDVPESEQTASIIEGLKMAAPIAEDAGITLVVEPLNTLVNHKGYFLARSDHAFDILKAVGSPNVKLLFDVYHQQITEGNLIANITQNIDMIGHFHSADVPGRNDLGSGEINWTNIKKAIDGTSYANYFGLEYAPLGDKMESIQNALKLLS